MPRWVSIHLHVANCGGFHGKEMECSSISWKGKSIWRSTMTFTMTNFLFLYIIVKYYHCEMHIPLSSLYVFFLPVAICSCPLYARSGICNIFDPEFYCSTQWMAQVPKRDKARLPLLLDVDILCHGMITSLCIPIMSFLSLLYKNACTVYVWITHSQIPIST